MKTKSFLILCILIMRLAAISQVKIGDNSTTVNSASLLELETTNKGFVLPRISVTSINSSAPLAAGLLTGTIVYNTNSGITGGSGTGIYYWDGSKWNFLANTTTTGNYWSINGNSGTSASSNFIGTTDAKDFVARTNNVERMRILGATVGSSQVGWIGMGIATTPKSALDVAGNYAGKNVITIQNTSTTGFSSVDMLDNAGNLATTFGFANSGTGTAFSGKAYLNGYGNDFLFTRGSSYDLIMKGSNGYVGLNISTPTERLHVVGNFYLNGAFMPGGSAGTIGYFLTSAGANTSPTWTNPNSIAWRLTGNSGTVASTNFIGTSDAVDFVTRTNNTERLRITSAGNIGIGLANPSYALSVLSASNPLYLSGVQATSTFATDSVLTINAGVVKKTPYSSLTGNFWSLTGNSGTNYATNFIGTTDNVSLRFRTNNIEQMLLDSLGTLSVGSYGAATFNTGNPPKLSVDYGTTTSNTIAYFRGSIDDYFQMNLRNKSNGIYASSDYVATADDGTDSTYYVDFGINSSTYAPSVDNWGGPHDAYLYSNSRHLLLGTQASNSDIIFLVGGGRSRTNAAMRIEGSTSNIIIGTGNNQSNATGNIIRGPNGGNGTNIPGGSLTLQGGSSNGNTAGGNLNLYGGGTVSGTRGSVNINVNTNSATNINTGTSASDVIIGNALNNINLPKLSASSVVLTDAGKNLTSTTPSANTYLYYNGSNFTWATAATLSSFSVTAPLTYNNLTGVFGINQSGASADGYLSSTDWNDFNNKVENITLNTPSSVFANPVNFSVSAGTATGTLSLNTQTANTIFAGPAAGAAAVPGFRALVAADIPSLAGSYIQNQTIQQASSNFNISGNGTIGTNFSVTGTSILTGAVTSKAGITNTGIFTTSGGIVNINNNSNFAANINTGTSTGNITIGNSSNNILLPKFNVAGGMIYTIAATGQIASTGSNMKWDDVNNRLGIGLTNPSYKLSVLAASDPLYLSGVQATATLTTDSVLTILNGVVKKAPYSSLANNFWSLTGNSGTIAGTNFIGTADAVDFVTKTNNAERIRVTSGGLIGIGTNAPTSDLTVFQSAGSGSSKGITFTGNSISGTNSGTGFLMSLGYNSAGNKQLWFGDADYAGNAAGSFARFVTTGTSFPVFDAVSGSGASRRYMAFGVAGDANSGVIFGTDNSNVSPGSQVWDNGNMTIGAGYKSFAAPANGLLIQGNVGIGTASPSSALHVVGASPLTLIGVQATLAFTTDSVLTIYNGVVKKTPYSSLPGSVSGWSLTGNSGTIAGTNFLGTTDATALQFRYNNIAAGSLDANNTSFGTSSSSVTGTSNTAIGYSATASNSSTAVGANAVASLANNTAIGNNATANVSNQATAIGASSQALLQNNVAVGYNAQATVSNQETVIGASSQAQGQNNIAIGYSAKALNSDKITVVGSSAQGSFQNNTVVGYNALATTNNQATAIGASAVAQAQNATALGYGASATGINSTAIGASATTSQNNALILGTSTTNVGIATSAPVTTASLDVNAKFKLGDVGTVEKNIVSTAAAVNASVPSQFNAVTILFVSVLQLASGTNYYDATITLPSTLTSTQASVSVSPSFDLPAGVSIAFARVISTTQVKVRFLNANVTTQTITGNLYITVTEF